MKWVIGFNQAKNTQDPNISGFHITGVSNIIGPITEAIKAEKSLIRAHRKPKKIVAKQVFKKIRKSPAGNQNKAETFGV